VIKDALEIIKNKTPQLFKHDLQKQHAMCCGGIMEIYIEPLMQAKKLFVFGGGHVGKAVVKHAADLGFAITVIDSREEIFDDWTITGYEKVTGPFPMMMPTLPFDESTFIVIATLDHPTDNEVLGFCLRKPHYYLGMIGSKNKIARTREKFISAGIATKEELDRVDMPIGLAIGAVTADEIAISIIAKIIMEKNK
jgi:xanthine dehydrogenase accessory factor